MIRTVRSVHFHNNPAILLLRCYYFRRKRQKKHDQQQTLGGSMKRILLLAALIGLVATPAYAGMYKCTNDAGRVEFRDRPCQSGRQQVLNKPAAAPAAAEPSGTGTAGAVSLQGAWCEYAVSLSPDGEKDSSDPATWTFNADGTMTYKSAAFNPPLQSRYRLNGDVIEIDNSLIGSWRIHRSTSSDLVVNGPFGGYGHWRRGGC